MVRRPAGKRGAISRCKGKLGGSCGAGHPWGPVAQFGVVSTRIAAQFSLDQMTLNQTHFLIILG